MLPRPRSADWVVPPGRSQVHDLAQRVEPEQRAETDRGDGEMPADDNACRNAAERGGVADRQCPQFLSLVDQARVFGREAVPPCRRSSRAVRRRSRFAPQCGSSAFTPTVTTGDSTSRKPSRLALVPTRCMPPRRTSRRRTGVVSSMIAWQYCESAGKVTLGRHRKGPPLPGSSLRL